MMGVWEWTRGVLEARVISADLGGFLSELEKAGISLQTVRQQEDMTLSFTIFRRDHKKLHSICHRKGYDLVITGTTGAYWTCLALLRRPVLILGCLLLIYLSIWAPGRIFFVYVEGNTHIPSALIIEQASACGISFGAERREVRSERMKNALLERLPQLQWAGVNTQGCVAVISVKERVQQSPTGTDERVTSIIAAMDAVVREVTITAGSALCVPGQSVKAGQVLISGYTDCGICVRAGRADGEVFGETQRSLSAVMPANYVSRREISSTVKKFSLIIGKKRINFDNNSGILGGEYVKIYMEQYVMLPGGFQLPVAFVTEEYLFYESEPTELEAPEITLLPFMEQYLQSQMLAGKILYQSTSSSRDDGLYRIDGIYGCYEMIGLLRPEESLPEYENNRTDR